MGKCYVLCIPNMQTKKFSLYPKYQKIDDKCVSVCVKKGGKGCS